MQLILNLALLTRMYYVEWMADIYSYAVYKCVCVCVWENADQKSMHVQTMTVTPLSIDFAEPVERRMTEYYYWAIYKCMEREIMRK